MIKILKKSTHRNLLDRVAYHAKRADATASEVEVLKEQRRIDGMLLGEAEKTIESLTAENERLQKLSVEADDTNSVTLRIGDDLTSITPVVKWKSEIKEKLIEVGLLSDANSSNTAIQVALMLIGQEALEQIIESFHPEFKETS